MKYLKPLMILALSVLVTSLAFAGSDEYLEKVNYRGAFGASNWAAGWTGMSEYGFFALSVATPGDVVTVTDADIAPGETVVWTADKVWLLDGRVFVDDGATLIIEAGTVIKAKPGQQESSSVLIVARGGKIYAEGTPEKPIIFTSENDDLSNPTVPPATAKGLWGGLIVLGKARINHPNGETNIEGIPTTDSRGLYGGADDEDCSGVLRYVSIRHGGTEIGEGNEINGLTMGAVGRGTTISHVEVFSNKDDGFEWFGGTVNCDHLVSAFCGDDAFDIDEGLRNKMQFLFAIQSDSTGDLCAEHDGAPESSVATADPLSYTVVYNATYLGGGMSGANGASVMRLREKFGGAYMNSIFGDYNGYGVRVDDDQTPHDASDRMAAGELTVGNNIWFNFSKGNTVEAVANNKAFLVNHLAANHNDLADPMLNSISRAQDNGLDPRPAVDGPAFNNLASLPADEDFFEHVPYRGAFGATNWAAGWSALAHYGFFSQPTPRGTEIVTVTDADIAPGETVVWTADKVWLLDGRVFVDDGATLIIEAGTVVKAKPGQQESSSVLIVARGGKIYAEGNVTLDAGIIKSNPIIFTSENDDLSNPTVPPATAKGLWGGLIVLGKARINHPNGETNIEGIPTTDSRGLYGGADDEDCSGVLRYVSIRHGGTEIGEGNEINGLTMGAVGRGTTISHVEVFSNKDDGFEWFGGTVNCDHLVSAFCGDDAFDIDEGLRNKMQFLFAIQSDSTGDLCAEHDGAPESSVATADPLSYTVVYNATYLGGGMSGANGASVMRLREKFGGAYMNSIFGDYNGYGVRVDDDQTPHDASDRMAAGELTVGNNIWFNFSKGNTVEAVANNKAFLVNHLAANHNDLADPMLNSISRAQDNGLDPRPAVDGPAFNNLAEIMTRVRYISYDSNVIPENFNLSQNYPNPFNPTTTIEFTLPMTSNVKLSVYNLLGQNVGTLLSGDLNAGVHRIQWDASSLPSGMYIYRLEAGSTVLNKKLTLLK
ncbi:MAG: T9SS type A sorting domain-containing protein [Candidatus Zhuqueibacterota bacterium]